MDILGNLIRTTRDPEILLVITDRISKLTRTILLKIMSPLVLSKAFLSHWVFDYGAPRFIITDKTLQLKNKYLQEVYRVL